MRAGAQRNSRPDVVDLAVNHENTAAIPAAEANPHSSSPWFRFFASDWLASTRSLKAAEAGILITLIAMLHERGEPVPEDHDRLARLCGARKVTFSQALETLLAEGNLTRTKGGIWSRMVQSEAEFRHERSQVAAKNVSERWKKTKQKQRLADTDEYIVQNQSQNRDVSNGDLPDRHSSTNPSLAGACDREARFGAPLDLHKYRVNQLVDHDGSKYLVLSIEEDGRRLTARAMDDDTRETFQVRADGSLEIDDIPF